MIVQTKRDEMGLAKNRFPSGLTSSEIFVSREARSERAASVSTSLERRRYSMRCSAGATFAKTTNSLRRKLISFRYFQNRLLHRHDCSDCLAITISVRTEATAYRPFRPEDGHIERRVRSELRKLRVHPVRSCLQRRSLSKTHRQ